jgi:hypothetical protein
MANNKDASLYGVPRSRKLHGKEISSSTSISFSSQLSSLLASTESPARATNGRPRPTKKADIFSSHNRNSKKRAAKDLEPDGAVSQRHHTEIGDVDDNVLHRSKRKMEEKARLYAAMKRGDYVPAGGDEARDERGLVDFDRKWAESEARGEGDIYDTSSDDGDGSDEDLVDYVDEFGRQRQGTRAEAAREERRKKIQAVDEPDRFTARPAPPSNLIFGDTIQSGAFNPDGPIAAKMEDMARKRDRSLTPPPEVHYDANSEIRTKGVGFYSFSKDKNGREKEMEALERERIQTEKTRSEQQARKDKRKAEVAERKKKIQEQKSKNEADRFLNSLAGDKDSSI